MTAGAAFVHQRLLLPALVLAVTALHLWVAEHIAAASRLGAGAAQTAPRRIEVAFVRELAPAAPPAEPPAPARPARRAPRRAAAPPAEPAASAPVPLPVLAEEVLTEAALPAVPVVPQGLPADPPLAVAAPEPAPEPASAPPPEAPQVALAAAPPASAPQAFEWPPSTRLSYTLTGYFRGPVDGSAQVEWLRREGRYQVHMDVFIGPRFAPLVSRRMSSEGEITEQGLKPLRYDEETRVVLRSPRRQAIDFEADRIVLPGGRERPAVAGVQDTASQFVQLTWLFTTQPQRLRAGEAVELPLALPRHVDVWRYEVVGEELLHTLAGTIPTFHVKPRREGKQGSDLLAEAWFAPSLQYLPVRIRIQQDTETSVDLLLERLPQQETAVPISR